jgi:hypothetical protein
MFWEPMFYAWEGQPMKSKVLLLIIGLALSPVLTASAAITVTVDPAAPWIGFMNVFEIPSHGGAYAFGSSWGTADLTATFSGSVLTLGPNSVNDPSSFWYTPSGGPGAMANKTMDASMYVEDSSALVGQTVNFTGNVLSNTLVSPYTSVAFIKDFAPDYSSSVSTTVPLSPGLFSITLATIPQAGRHVQYGFETVGPDVWVTDRGPIGTVQVAAVPEPAGLTLICLGGLAAGIVARRRT